MNKGEKFCCAGSDYVVMDSVGQGGQGSVCKVKQTSGGKLFAAKVLSEKNPTVLAMKKENINRLIRDKADDKSAVQGHPLKINHTFPLGKFEYGKDRDTAYIMEYAKAPSLDKMLLTGELQSLTMREKLLLIKQVAQSVQIIHDLGYCYTDINWGNFLWDRQSGWLYVVDCENVASNTDIQTGRITFVLGTGFFMAPEVAFGLANAGANADRYALANMIFRILTDNLLPSPYHGKKMFSAPQGCQNMLDVKELADEGDIDDGWRTFVFDPVDGENGLTGIFDDPTKPNQYKKRKELDEVAEIWKVVDDRLKKLFYKAFRDPLKAENYNTRPAAFEWAKAVDGILAGKAIPEPHKSRPQQIVPEPTHDSEAYHEQFKNPAENPFNRYEDFVPAKRGSGSPYGDFLPAGGIVRGNGIDAYPDFVPSGKKKVNGKK